MTATLTRTPLTRQTLKGVWAALIVPWTDRDELDEARFANEVRAYGNTGVSGVYTGGTTGEFYAQDDATFARVTAIACREAHAVGLPVQIGATALSNRTAAGRIKVALQHGADAIQIALPFWLELRDDEIISFMDAVTAAAGKTPIVLYLTGRSKRKIKGEFFGQIAAKYPTFIGTKDTGSTVDEVKAMLAAAPDMNIFGGEDFYERVPAGGTGGYCSVTGLNPQAVVRYYDLCRAGKLAEAKPYHDQMHRYIHELLLKWNRETGMLDSAIDRVQRVAGGVDVGVRCQGPYNTGSQKHVDELLAWVKQNAPLLARP
jgi:dihydrodipicolinate synthase/N-acetylneuraminate lyase